MRLFKANYPPKFNYGDGWRDINHYLDGNRKIGIQSVINDFEESFRANNLEIVKDTPVLPPERFRIAISSGHLLVVVKNTRARKK